MKNRGAPSGAPPPLPPVSMAYESGAPSKARRETLRMIDEDAVPVLSNFCPIERYFVAAEKVRDAFFVAYQEGKLDDAYVYGLRFSNFAIKALPKHDYYDSPRPKLAAMRNQNLSDLESVLTKMEHVKELMDEEEFQRQLEEERRRLAEEEQIRLELEKNERKWRVMMKDMRRGNNSRRKLTTQEEEAKKDIGTSAAMKLDLLSSGGRPAAAAGTRKEDDEDLDLDARFAALSTPLPRQESTRSSFEQLLTDIPTLEDTLTSELPKPVPVPNGTGPPLPAPPPSSTSMPPPPSYSQVMGEGGKPAPPPPPPPPPPPKRKSSAHKIPIKTLREVYSNDYDTLRKQKKVEVFKLGTYQGKSYESTNGCTVISPLVAAGHLKMPAGASISDAAIENVIDREAPPILRAVRSKLSLGGGALIIPSDVHDYLVDEKVLQQEKFVGVCGGNIMDDNHMGEFLRMLETGQDSTAPPEKPLDASKKVAATLFFHEHVVSILKIPTASGEAWYDLVDSLPRNGGATRTRCKNRNALEALLRWYASAKFSNSDCNYIDKNDWNDLMCDFDPRVFQGFVWVE